jgi:type II secretory pathway pseudopilin PulG
MRKPKLRGKAGFSLMETMLAAVLLGLALAVVMQTINLLSNFSARTRDVLARDRLLSALFENLKQTAHLYQTDFASNVSGLPLKKQDFAFSYGNSGITVADNDHDVIDGGRMDFEISALRSDGVANGLFLIRVRILDKPEKYSAAQELKIGDYKDYEFITGLK